jgi:tetratricopeptide (TPR) repeat protein
LKEKIFLRVRMDFLSRLATRRALSFFRKVSNSWGSFYYDPAEDALRVTVKNQTLDKSVEWLKYEFINQEEDAATIAMSWEKRMIPFKVQVERKALQVAAFKSDLRTTRPYYDFIAAAQWCVENNYELEQALAWMDRAIYFRVMGEKNFRSLSTKATVLMKMNRVDEAKKVMEEAVPLGTITDVHYYGRQLLSMKQVDEAFKVYKANYEKHPNEFTTNVGMGRAYSAMGNYKKALGYMKAALPQSPNDFNKINVETMIKKLEEGKDVN